MTVTDRVLQNAVACSVPISGRKTSNSCPQCRKQPLEIVVDPRIQRRITGATVHCPNCHFDCNWVGGFGRVTQHLDDDCEFGGSAHIHDVKKFVKHSFHENHAYDLCLWRDANCPCCEVKDSIFGDIHYTYVICLLRWGARRGGRGRTCQGT